MVPSQFAKVHLEAEGVDGGVGGVCKEDTQVEISLEHPEGRGGIIAEVGKVKTGPAQ